MKRNLAFAIGITVFTVLAIDSQVVGEERSGLREPQRHHTHYKVIDTGSFGGPNSHMSIGAHILNNNGTFTGFADTA